jgi:ABC-type branched-subunit amino acid transport system ATPase component
LARRRLNVEIENDVICAYGMVQILRDVSFKVEEKEIVSIIGPNGAGKTTLRKNNHGLP